VKEDVEHAWQLAPDTWNESYQAAFEGTGKDAIQPAIDLMTNRIEQEPGDEVAYFNRGDRHARLGRWDLAADDFGQATRLAPDNVWWWVFDTFPSLRIGNGQRYRADCEQILRFVRRTPEDDGLQGACSWVYTTRFSPIEDIPGVREFLQRRLDEVDAVPEPTELQTAEQREVRIRLGLPTPELDKPMSSDPTAASANERLREALRAIQLGRVQEAQDLYDQAREMIKTLRMDDTGKDFWLLTRCEILAEEVGELLSHARK
jgi:tetratricopeptide (TPR) repeat protein